MGADTVPFLQLPTNAFTTVSGRKFIARQGWDGYGLFWGVACSINAEADAALPWADASDMEALASVLGVVPSWLDDVVTEACGLGLLEIDAGTLRCPLATKSHESVARASAKARKAAAKRWETRR